MKNEKKMRKNEKKMRKNERMANLSMMAMAVGRLIRSLAVSIVLRLLPSLLIDSIWGGRSIKEAANDSFIELPERAFQSLGKLTITVVLVENSNLDCSTKSPLISKFVPQTVEFNNSTKLLFPPIVCFWPLNQPNRSLSIPSISITHISEH